MTEGDGHVIDPAGDARRALQAVVAEQGPQALSNAVIMDGICQARLSHLPGEATLIGSAARSDVPRLLGDLIPRLGNYGAIQSVAATLAQAHGLDTAASVWVVREFARALGLIASGGTQPTARGGPAGSAGAGGAGAASGMAAGSGAAGMGAAGVAGGPGGSGGAGGAGGPGGVPPRRPSSGGRGLSRNTIGIAAAIALVAGYLGVAGVAHLSPFPAKAVVATSSTSAPPTQGNNTSPSPAASQDPSPPSDYQVLLTKIPNVIRGTNNCHNDGTGVGAIAVSECTGLQGVAARVIFYYLFSDATALGNGFSTFLKNENFNRQSECTTNNNFVSFIAECESNFTGKSPAITGSIAEYVNKNNEPIIVSTDNQQHVMAVMVGTNDGDLLAYWKLLRWVVP